MSAGTLINSVAAQPPEFAAPTVAETVAQQYGLHGVYTLLVSERDQNFRLCATDGKCYVVKIVSLAEDPAVTDFQIAALSHLEKAGIRYVPSVVRTTSGKGRGTIGRSDESSAVLRIVTWVDGRLLDDTTATPAIARRLGARLAELDAALEGFQHAGDGQVLLWDIQRAGELRELLVYVGDRAVRELLESVLDDFENYVAPAIRDMPRQVIHNDANTENVLIDDTADVCGIIDFGDMLRAPRVVEVSNSAAYLRVNDADPLRLIAPLVAGYHRVLPLEACEIDLLFDLIRTRLAMTLIILFWRLDARDEDDPYRRKSLEGGTLALDFLRRVNDLGREGFAAGLRDGMSFETAG